MVRQIAKFCTDIQRHLEDEEGKELRFKNHYKLDEAYTYIVDNKLQVVTTNYRGIKFQFLLPVITVNLSPPIKYFNFKKTYKNYIIDTVKLEYTLSMYYVISLNYFIKDNIDKDFL